jgi:hypothetical protein
MIQGMAIGWLEVLAANTILDWKFWVTLFWAFTVVPELDWMPVALETPTSPQGEATLQVGLSLPIVETRLRIDWAFAGAAGTAMATASATATTTERVMEGPQRCLGVPVARGASLTQPGGA